MRIKTIYKEIDCIYRLSLSPKSSDRREALVRLANLRDKLREKVEKKEKTKKGNGKQIQGLLSWYLKVWEGNPPEYLKHEKTTANRAIAKNLKELLGIYGKDEEALKRDYLEFKNLQKERVKWEMKRLWWDGGIFNFRKVLPQWKQLKEEAQKKTSKWGKYDEKQDLEELNKELSKKLLLWEDEE